MSKRVRHHLGFYGTLFNDVCNHACNLKYHPKVKPSVKGIYEVEHVVAKWVKGGEVEYFIQWQNYSSSENMWEPAEHLPEDIIAAFENRSVDPLRTDESRESLALLSEKGLKLLTACNETITMQNNVLWAISPGVPSDLCEEKLIAAGLGPYLKKYLTVPCGGCCVNALVYSKLFLGKSLSFLDEQGHKTASRPVEKVQIKFMKSYFAGCIQWAKCCSHKNCFFRSHWLQ